MDANEWERITRADALEAVEKVDTTDKMKVSSAIGNDVWWSKPELERFIQTTAIDFFMTPRHQRLVIDAGRRHMYLFVDINIVPEYPDV